MMRLLLSMLAVPLLMVGALSAAESRVTGGKTSVFLDPVVLNAFGLSVSGTTDDVLPGSLPDSVGFGINPRNATDPVLPTSFAYDSADFFNTFSGKLEHTGSVFFVDGSGDETQTGDFTIGFDSDRAVDDASGFFVASNAGLVGVLFDLEAPSELVALPESLTAEARLLVSPELAQVLGDDTAAGITIGSARIEAEAVPEPSTVALGLMGAVAFLLTYRRRR